MQEMWDMWVQSLGGEDPLEEKMATHSSILTWRIPCTEKSDELQSMGSQRVGHDGSDLVCMHIWMLSLLAWEERVCLLGFCLVGSVLCRFTQAAGSPGCWVPGSISGLLHCNPHGGSLWRLLLASSVLADIGTIIGNFSACHKQAWRVAGTGLTGMCP